jgi:hypothetical protein
VINKKKKNSLLSMHIEKKGKWENLISNWIFCWRELPFHPTCFLAVMTLWGIEKGSLLLDIMVPWINLTWNPGT